MPGCRLIGVGQDEDAESLMRRADFCRTEQACRRRVAHVPKLSQHGFKAECDVRLAFCWAHGCRKLIAAKPKKGSPIVDEALLRIAALYKVEDTIRGSDPDQRRQSRQTLSLPLTDAFFIWPSAQSKVTARH